MYDYLGYKYIRICRCLTYRAAKIVKELVIIKCTEIKIWIKAMNKTSCFILQKQHDNKVKKENSGIPFYKIAND